MAADFLFLVILVASFLLGIVRGAVSQLLAFAAWFLSFVVAAYLAEPLGNWIMDMQNGFSIAHAQMLGWLLAFLVLFLVSLAIIEIRGSSIHLTRRPVVDELVGGLLMLGVGVLFIGSVAIILDSYYAADPPLESTFGLADQLNSAYETSSISHALHQSLIPGLTAIFDPLLPDSASPGG